MSTANLGSIGAQIHGQIENIPSSMSGAILLQMINNQVAYMEDYTGLTIGSTAIQDRFQAPLVNLTISEVLHSMQTFGADVGNISLGDFSLGKGAGDALASSAELYRERGMEQLKSLGFRFNNFQSL